MMKQELNEVLLSQTHEDGRVRLDVRALGSGGEPVELAASLRDPQGDTLPFPKSGGPAASLIIDRPQLWWPRGYGGQPLYTLCVKARAGGRPLGSWEGGIGLRKAGLSIEKDRYGESFAHEINGVRIFAMGAGYVPGKEEDAPRLLEDAALAGFNCVRALGACPDSFYDICDRLGLMVWQDLTFPFPENGLTEDLTDAVRTRVRQEAARLLRHPSVVLWCGGSELELSGSVEAAPRQKADYIRLFEYIIPSELRKLDPQAVYWPSSPSSGGGFDQPDSLDRGDAHPRCSDFREPGRYVSSFGTPSCPCLPTAESYTEPGERNLFSRAMEGDSPRSTAHIMANIQRHYLCPSSFEAAVYASQLSQGEILRAAAQHYRRHRGRCMGALYRQLNDSRPEVSCSSIDYAGRWKALHYYARRFFAPLMLSCEGPSGPEKSLRLCVTNDTVEPRAVLIKWALRTRLCRVLREETISLTVPPLESAWLEEVKLPEAEEFGDFVSYEMYERGVPVSFGTALFTRPKYYPFLDPELECRVRGEDIIVTSKAYAQGVAVLNASEDMVLSDNYFDMLPGERRVRIIRGRPDGLKLRSVYDIK